MQILQEVNFAFKMTTAYNTQVSIWHWHEQSLQCESKHFTPLMFSGNISPKTEIFKIKFYMPIVCSYIRKTANFYSIISNYDKVLPY